MKKNKDNTAAKKNCKREQEQQQTYYKTSY